MKIKIYAKSHTLNIWVYIILNKFNDLEFVERENNLAKILGITSQSEIKKIKEASFIAFGRTLGVESFEDGCKKLGISTELPKIFGLDLVSTNKFLAEYKLNVIIKALNEGWYPNWEDANEYKYWPYFNMNKNGGFSCWYTLYYLTPSTSVPSALLLKSSELAYYCGVKFTPLYKDFYQ